jgi:hypothetical protein
MALGIETNNVAPQLIQNSGAALVQGIRQIGQQISGHLTELQTKRDLGALAQEMQGLNVQSNEFPIQLAQLTGRHPLAAKDDRAKMMLMPLGAAHAQWQAGEAEARAFGRAMTMQGMRTEATRTLAEEQEARIRSRPPKALAPKGSVPAPGLPGWSFDKDAGQFNPPSPEIAGKLPAAGAKPMTEYQRAQIRRAERKDRISALNQEINQFDSDIASAVRQYESSFDREEKAADAAEKSRHQADKTEIGKVADQLKAEKAKRLEALRKLREDDAADAAIVVDVVEPELGAAPEVLPPVGAVAPTAPSEMVLVIDPNGVPGRVKASQLETALQNGYKRR